MKNYPYSDIPVMSYIYIFLLFRGFYKSGNYVAAINAFTAALMLDSNIPSYPYTSI